MLHLITPTPRLRHAVLRGVNGTAQHQGAPGGGGTSLHALTGTPGVQSRELWMAFWVLLQPQIRVQIKSHELLEAGIMASDPRSGRQKVRAPRRRTEQRAVQRLHARALQCKAAQRRMFLAAAAR